jgi:predicted RNA-binding protein with PIN domain
MRYLIDGYNFLYATGAVGESEGPGALQEARRKLLARLVAAYGGEPGRVTVVFDAAGSAPGVRRRGSSRGVEVRYATGVGEEADDVIEELIRQDTAPRRLVVVSDDRRLQRAGRRRHCAVMNCKDYLAEIVRLDRARRPVRTEERPLLTPQEVRRWLAEFGELGRDPLWKELNPFDFDGADAPDGA